MLRAALLLAFLAAPACAASTGTTTTSTGGPTTSSGATPSRSRPTSSQKALLESAAKKAKARAEGPQTQSAASAPSDTPER